jgi:2,5-diketo-D-gluconate reductase B
MQTIDANGVKLPALGFGTWQLEGATCRHMVTEALAMGYRHIDTAQMYGNEAEVGQGLAASDVPRDQVFLTTKVWMDRLHDGDLRASVEESLRKLGTGDVDLLLIHWPNPEVPLGESLRAMQDLQAEGKVKYTGVSNFTVDLMREALERKGADIVCNQVEYHPFLSQQPVLDYARDRGLFVTAYCPLAKGRVHDDASLAEIGRKHGKSPAQVALRWLVRQAKVAAIPRTANPEHARANLDIFDFDLDAEDLERIARLDARTRLINPSWAPQWDNAA